MTGGQRRYHVYIWLLIAVVIPVLMILGVKDLSYRSIKQTTTSDIPKAGSSLILDQELLKTEILSDSGTTMLEIYLKKPIEHPSALVYTLNDRGEKDQYLGQLEGVGKYSFELPSTVNGILLYDAIKDMEIEKMTFSWD